MFSSLLFAIGVQGKAGNKMHSRITITTTFVKLLQAESRWMDTFCTKSVQWSTGYTCFVARRHDSQEVVFLYSVKHLLLAAIFKPERPNIPVTLSMYLWICNFRISSQNSGRFVVIYRGTFLHQPHESYLTASSRPPFCAIFELSTTFFARRHLLISNSIIWVWYEKKQLLDLDQGSSVGIIITTSSQRGQKVDFFVTWAAELIFCSL